ncbi:hypothetical protein V1282_001388 [Nitrobacteraceae bacterium AZCC 2146]
METIAYVGGIVLFGEEARCPQDNDGYSPFARKHLAQVLCAELGRAVNILWDWRLVFRNPGGGRAQIRAQSGPEGARRAGEYEAIDACFGRSFKKRKCSSQIGVEQFLVRMRHNMRFVQG